MNKDHYMRMIYEHLNDTKTYKRTDETCDKKVRLNIEKLVKKYENTLTKQESAYLTNYVFKTSNFYGIPKVHKSKIINDAIEQQKSEYIETLEPNDLSLRPIVAGPICPTRNLSNLIDILLKPFIIHVKSYIKDSVDFLNKCKRQSSDSNLLVTFDVKSLYTSIPHEFGLEAIKFWLEKHPQSLHKRFSKDFILESSKFILENNTCTFNDEYYTQISGTAMGTIFAPTYATLTMGYLEIKLYETCEIKFNTTVRNFIYDNWSRFLDDCEIILNREMMTPETLLQILNSLNPAIQFTMETSSLEIPFLDILIQQKEGKICMDLYRKPTDTQRCLDFNSCHPTTCKTNIPFTMARRICTIVEKNFST